MIIFSKIDSKQMLNFFFYLVFLSRIFPIHMAAGEGGGYFFNSLIDQIFLKDTGQSLIKKTSY